MVIDASAAVRALGPDAEAMALRGRIQDAACHAPYLFDAEVGQALRGRERAGQIDGASASAALVVLFALIDHRYPHVGPLADRAWSLRHNLSFYDALYVALAAELDLPLVTADARLGRAPDLPCTVELV